MLYRRTLPFASMTLVVLLVLAAAALFWVQSQALSKRERAFYMAGAVRKPGRYVIPYGERATILKALEISGGLTETGVRSYAQIIRYEHGSRSIIEVNLSEVFRGKFRPVQLVSGDILLVTEIGKNLNLYDSPPREIKPFRVTMGVSKA